MSYCISLRHRGLWSIFQCEGWSGWFQLLSTFIYIFFYLESSSVELDRSGTRHYWSASRCGCQSCTNAAQEATWLGVTRWVRCTTQPWFGVNAPWKSVFLAQLSHKSLIITGFFFLATIKGAISILWVEGGRRNRKLLASLWTMTAAAWTLASLMWTGQDFLIKGRAENGTTGFSPLLTGFERSLVKQRGESLLATGATSLQVLPLVPAGASCC